MRIWDGTGPAPERPYAVPQYPVPHLLRPEKGLQGGKNDFMLYATTKQGVDKIIYVEVKKQEYSGSVDEKVLMCVSKAKFALASLQYDTFLLVLIGSWWVTAPDIPYYYKNIATPEFKVDAYKCGHVTNMEVAVGEDELARYLSSNFKLGDI
jgi:hypothetical protein